MNEQRTREFPMRVATLKQKLKELEDQEKRLISWVTLTHQAVSMSGIKTRQAICPGKMNLQKSLFYFCYWLFSIYHKIMFSFLQKNIYRIVQIVLEIFLINCSSALKQSDLKKNKTFRITDVGCAFLIFLFSSISFQTQARSEPNLFLSLVKIKKVLSKYAETGSVQMKFKKEDYFKQSDKTETKRGHLVLSQSRIKMEIKKPEKELIVIDDKAIWIEGILPQYIHGNPQVMKLNFIKNKSGQRKSPLEEFLNNRALWNQIKVKSSKKRKHILICDIVTSNSPDMRNLKYFIVEIDSKRNSIEKIYYENEKGNKTTLTFSKIKWSSKKRNIIYKPPEKAQVVED